VNATPVVVLNTFTHVGVGIMRSLGRLGVHVYAVHPKGRTPSGVSRYCRKTFVWDIRHADRDESVSFLLGIARRLGRDRPILIPTEDISCLFVADNSETLSEFFLLPSQPPGLARGLSSKRGMYALCKQHGVPTPETYFPESRKDVEAFAAAAQFPVVVKSVDTPTFRDDDPRRAGAGKAIVRQSTELLETYEDVQARGGSVLLQEYIPGGAESVWMFNGYFDANSDCLVAFTGRKLRQYPPYTGQTSLGLCTWNESVAEMTKTFLKALGYRGIVDMGYRYDGRDGRYKLLDVNPRIGAAFRLFLGTNGMDVVRALYLDLTGSAVPPTIAREGRRWLVENYDLVSSLKYRRDGRLTLGTWLRSFRNVEEAAWTAIDDPAPFAMMCARSLGYGATHFLGKKEARSVWRTVSAPAEA
jgi:D-aspartate ligase